MAASHVIRDTRHICGYCCEILSNMQDPKELDCGHVHCSHCMRMKYDDVGGVICPQSGCGRWYEELDIDSLKQVPVENSAGQLTCDRSKCKGKPAVNYCVDCGEKLCRSHVQSHNGHYEDEHVVIAIEVYSKSPRQYKKVFCDVHTQELVIRGCENCNKLACVECDGNDSCSPPGEDGEVIYPKHKYRRLDELVREITRHLKQKLHSIAAKVAELEKVDKEAWRALDVVQVQCQECMDEIDRLWEEQVTLISRRCEQVKEKVLEHQQEMVGRVELFSADLVSKQEDMQSTQTTVNSLLMDGHKVDVVSHRHSMDIQLSSCMNEQLDVSVLIDKPALIVRERDSLTELDLVQFPLSLQCDSLFDMESPCYSSCIRSNGDVLIGCEDGLRAIDNASEAMIYFTAPFGSVSSVVEHNNVTYILHRVDDVYKVEMCLPNLFVLQSETLFEFPDANHIPAMAVSDRFVIVFHREYAPSALDADNADADSEDVTHLRAIYDLTTRQVNVVEVDCSQHPYFLPDGHLLVVQRTQIEKVKIEDNELVPVWTCDGLSDAFMACSDTDGFIYVSGWDEIGLIYVISPQGKILREIRDGALPYYSGQFCVRGDTLYLPECEGTQLYSYQLVR